MCTRSFQQHRLQSEQPATGRMGFLSPSLQLIQSVFAMECHIAAHTALTSKARGLSCIQ